MQRGQTVQAKLTLGDADAGRARSRTARFFNDTGGTWVFVVDTTAATARPSATSSLGRRNTDYIEVLDGLQPGEQVITSSYTGLTDKDRLTFSSAD